MKTINIKYLLLIITISLSFSLFLPVSLNVNAQETDPLYLYLVINYLERTYLLIKENFLFSVDPEEILTSSALSMQKAISPHSPPEVSLLSNERINNWSMFSSQFLSLAKMYPQKTEILAIEAVKGMVQALNDPYSQILKPQDYKKFKKPFTDKEMVGIGIELLPQNGKLIIAGIVSGSPAEKADIRTGDILVAINGEEIKKQTLDKVMEAIDGKPGEPIKLSLCRKKTTFTITVFREKWILPQLQASIQGNIGIFKINVFGDNIRDELQKKLLYFRRKKVGVYLIDLRDNPGGNINETSRVAAMFLPRGSLVFYKQTRYKQIPYYTIEDGEFTQPIAILVNEGTLSAAEMLAAAMKEHNRASIYGTKTGGKSLIQTVFSLRNGWGLKLTTGRYLTPSGKDVNRKGIMPDIIIPCTQKDKDSQLEMVIMDLKKRYKY